MQSSRSPLIVSADVVGFCGLLAVLFETSSESGGQGQVRPRRGESRCSVGQKLRATRSRCACFCPRPRGRWSSWWRPASSCRRSIAMRSSAPSTAGSASICKAWWPMSPRRSSRPIAARRRSASRCSNCRCRAGTGRSRCSAVAARAALLALAVGQSACPVSAARPPRRVDGTRRGYVIGPEDQRLRMLERTVDLGEDGRYLIVGGRRFPGDRGRDAQRSTAR